MRFVVLLFYAPHLFLSFALVTVVAAVAVVVIVIVVCVLLAWHHTSHTPRTLACGLSWAPSRPHLGTALNRNYACKIYLMVVLLLLLMV